ncbi:MAG: MmgE/PrpD family protein, partial [Candidatus Neomarinimicrobiota bacterium]
KDGQTVSQYLEYPKGDPREPMTDEDIAVKFNALSAAVLSPNRQAEIRAEIGKIEMFESVTDFMKMLEV